jgi:hypothetical protein
MSSAPKPYISPEQYLAIERYSRLPSGEWSYETVSQPEQSLQLESMDCVLSVAEVYDKLALER